MDKEQHKERHKFLHECLDELVADFLIHNKESRPSDTNLFDFMNWSYRQTLGPTEIEKEELHNDVSLL